MDDARERFQLTQTIPDFNKQITIVSIVGGRGVGKSTVSSLLSGNHSMFTTGSGSVGTTTTGADISTIIPTTDYADILGGQLGIEISKVSFGIAFVEINKVNFSFSRLMRCYHSS